MKVLKLLTILCFILLTNMVSAYKVNFTSVANFSEPYNFSYAFKMDAKENVAYLSTVTHDNNNKLLHLWSIKEANNTYSDPEHKVEISNDLLNGISVTDQEPSWFHLAVHYDPSNKTSTQYIGYIDKNQKNTLVIWQRYPCEPTGSYCVRIISEIVPISVNAFDMAVLTDGNLLVATVDNTSHVNLYKYITHYLTAPEPVTLIGQDSKLTVPWTGNFGQFKLVLIGQNEVPYVVFPYSSSDSKHSENGRIAAAYVTNWNENPNNNISQSYNIWSSAYTSDINLCNWKNDLRKFVDITSEIQVDAIASQNDNSLFATTIRKGLYGVVVAKFQVVSESNIQWNNFHEEYDLSGKLNRRRSVLATDGSSVYGIYDKDEHASVMENHNHAFTAAEFFKIDDSSTDISKNNIAEVSRKDYDDEMKYIGLVMFYKDYSGFYKGFTLSRDQQNSNPNGLTIKGIRIE